ncbi:Crp/Fnr family transcriptional regulator [Colwellia psychrerythraea]|uniref:Transcriptional regulator, Crp/Fnr family n=1 Tax=Colwellia psychrerythraea TaxID=28229 RepID=A0A099KGL2_COLPS|nr:helix-turn-helix domain-containing protein [Colwellia psychrerythraea]KGJ89934.1 transcriptional regulator, Crp/Fnr family [Colwellia psychrerythraea]
MTITSKAAMQDAEHYIDCEKCSMQAVCRPIGSEEQTIDLTSNYLTRQVKVKANQSSSLNLRQTPGAKLFEQGQALTAIFAVCTGTFKLSRKNEAGIERVVGFRFPGELIAEDALFLKEYNYSAIALGDNTVCKINVEKLSACSKVAPEFQQNLILLLTKQSFEQQRNSQALIGQKSAECLLAAFLLNICQRNAKHSGCDTQTELAISRHDIASFLGIRRETLSRLLSKFQREQLIKIKNKHLTLLSIDGLKQLDNN